MAHRTIQRINETDSLYTYDEIIRSHGVNVLRLAAHPHNDLKSGLLNILFIVLCHLVVINRIESFAIITDPDDYVFIIYQYSYIYAAPFIFFQAMCNDIDSCFFQTMYIMKLKVLYNDPDQIRQAALVFFR